MEKAIFLDRDGTINEDVGYLCSMKKLTFIPRAFDALRLLQKRYALFIVTNQPGVGRVAFSEADLLEFNRDIEEALFSEGIRIRKTYYCPHLKEDKCICRKPSVHFLKQAEKDFCIDLKSSIVMGDHPHDMEMAKRAGASPVYLLTGHGKRHRHELSPASKPALIAENIYEAAAWVMEKFN